MSDDIAVPPSIELLDVRNGMLAERYLWIRGLSDRTLAPQARIDLIDEAQRVPGELLYLASRDGTVAASTLTIRDDGGAGSCYLTVFARVDPGDEILGDLVRFASDRARAGGVAQVRCGDVEDRPHIVALRERHGFTEHERWRRFHLDAAHAPATATLTADAIPDGIRVATLASRPSLAEGAFRVYAEGLADTPGDFPRPRETRETWLMDLDSSPIRGRELAVLLLDGDSEQVLAYAELERLAMGSDRAWVEFLAVDRERRGRGLAKLAKRAVAQHAFESGLRRLHTVNHADNAVMCAVNEQLGWSEDPVRVSLALDL